MRRNSVYENSRVGRSRWFQGRRSCRSSIPCGPGSRRRHCGSRQRYDDAPTTTPRQRGLRLPSPPRRPPARMSRVGGPSRGDRLACLTVAFGLVFPVPGACLDGHAVHPLRDRLGRDARSTAGAAWPVAGDEPRRGLLIAVAVVMAGLRSYGRPGPIARRDGQNAQRGAGLGRTSRQAVASRCDDAGQVVEQVQTWLRPRRPPSSAGSPASPRSSSRAVPDVLFPPRRQKGTWACGTSGNGGGSGWTAGEDAMRRAGYPWHGDDIASVNAIAAFAFLTAPRRTPRGAIGRHRPGRGLRPVHRGIFAIAVIVLSGYASVDSRPPSAAGAMLVTVWPSAASSDHRCSGVRSIHPAVVLIALLMASRSAGSSACSWPYQRSP